MKTRLGISVGLMGAMVYFMGLFSGYLLLVLLVSYVLLFEENEWLKYTAIKAVTVCVMFSVVITCIDMVPTAIGVLTNFLSIFKISFSLSAVTNLVSMLDKILGITEKVILLVLGVKALHQGTISICFVDDLINRHFLK